VVALMITKGSTPFTDKGHPGKAAEPTAGQVADPNKPCTATRMRRAKRPRTSRSSQQRRPAGASATGGAGAAGADQLQAMVDKIQGTQAAPASRRRANAANVTPQPPPAGRDAAGGDDKYIYCLQAGAFREVADAENVRAKLALLGFEANISDRTTDTGVLHRVRALQSGRSHEQGAQQAVRKRHRCRRRAQPEIRE
jgi:cell division protein FtsN